MRRIFEVALCLLLAGCTDDIAARKTLDDAGYTSISTDGYAFWMCGRDDFSHTAFTAKNPRGKLVHGAVCCGLITKGCTIRF